MASKRVVNIGSLVPKWFIVTNPICLGKLHPYPLVSRSSAEKVASIENDHHSKAFDGLISEVVPLYAIPDKEVEVEFQCLECLGLKRSSVHSTCYTTCPGCGKHLERFMS